MDTLCTRVDLQTSPFVICILKLIVLLLLSPSASHFISSRPPIHPSACLTSSPTPHQRCWGATDNLVPLALAWVLPKELHLGGAFSTSALPVSSSKRYRLDRRMAPLVSRNALSLLETLSSTSSASPTRRGHSGTTRI